MHLACAVWNNSFHTCGYSCLKTAMKEVTVPPSSNLRPIQKRSVEETSTGHLAQPPTQNSTTAKLDQSPVVTTLTQDTVSIFRTS